MKVEYQNRERDLRSEVDLKNPRIPGPTEDEQFWLKHVLGAFTVLIGIIMASRDNLSMTGVTRVEALKAVSNALKTTEDQIFGASMEGRDRKN